MIHTTNTAAPGGQASTGRLTEHRAVLADITHHDTPSIYSAALSVLRRSPDRKERKDARAVLRLIEKGTIR